MVRRIAEEVEGYIVELGSDGRLARLQLDELLAGVEDERRDVVRDYLPDDDPDLADDAVATLGTISTERLLMPQTVARVLEVADSMDLDSSLQPRGYRLLARVPRLPASVIDDIVARYGSLQKVMRATTDDLEALAGVEPGTARVVKEGLARLAESSILDRYG
jgi:diadenylate cyclase